MGKDTLKNKLKTVNQDDARTSLFASLDEFEAANGESKKKTVEEEITETEQPAAPQTATAPDKTETPDPQDKAPQENNQDTATEAPTESELSLLNERIKKTYYFDFVHVEAIRIMAFSNGVEISTVLRDLLENAIPDEYLEAAKQRVLNGTAKIPKQLKK